MNQSLHRLRRPALIMIGVGLTLGVLLDGLHTHFGATTYPNPVFAKAAWWAWPIFAIAYLSGMLRPYIDETPLLPKWKPALGMTLFITAYALTVAPFEVSTRVALLIGLFATGFHFCDPSRACLIVSFVGAFVGPCVEIFLVRGGHFVHHEAHFEGIPVWLPFLYMNSGVGLGSLALWLVQNEPTEETALKKSSSKRAVTS